MNQNLMTALKLEAFHFKQVQYLRYFFSLPCLVLCVFLFRRDAVSDLALHFLNKMKILVVRDIERDEIEFTCKVV